MMMMMKMVEKQKQISSGGSSSSSSSRSNVVELTEDLILEICSHLHPVSLLRFKFVSKNWYSLFSNPHFLVRQTLLLHHQLRSRRALGLHPYHSPLHIPHSRILLHRSFTAGNSKILILPTPPQQNEDDEEGEGDDDVYQKLSPLVLQNLIDYQNLPEKGKLILVDSCNGLLLYAYRLDYQIHEKQSWYVCNPITHDYIKLPILDVQEHGLKILSHSNPNLVFEPSSSSLCLTFKVITWLRCHYFLAEEEVDYRLYVYSSETRSWRFSISVNEFPGIFNFVWRDELGKGVLCNGVLYWSHVSLCYDVEKDRISTLKFPHLPLGYTDRTLYYLGECGGRLRLIEHFYNHFEQKNHFLSIFDVMELNEDQQQQQQQGDEGLWTLKYRVNIGEEGYYAGLIRRHRRGVYILDLYKTKTKKA